ncbi:5-methyltetrahydrofolate--homocysteine methyltransferase [Clostridium sp. A1-XYC3]|uniref:5-methyltetrahydrofolate--homocysteine methyltransferase n=1 Tax=Clostridium tanneri TaxID=3037988 RepID=A0ABU4JP71_9CLOT|nr:5-methyltetrahydrofolate--homocysteine methyltransferase [Clostridium sp. A1-XYC3]MDW8799763.1 5-methyltetrahydrofolate--homocysteine methyltransferase [Clostridium sp. A1-XYC3]
MDVILDFQFKLDKGIVINTLKSYCEFITDEEIDSMYNNLLPVLYDSVQPAAIFTIEQKGEDFKFDVIQDCKHIVYCVITMGDKVTEQVNQLFSYGRMKDGMVLDAMATSYLFELSYQLFKEIYEKCNKLGLGLSCRIAPGDGEIPLWYQKNILGKLDAENFLGITMVDDCMLSSVRSMAYIYGADEKRESNKKDHDCSKCNNRDYCSMKKI